MATLESLGFSDPDATTNAAVTEVVATNFGDNVMYPCSKDYNQAS